MEEVGKVDTIEEGNNQPEQKSSKITLKSPWDVLKRFLLFAFSMLLHFLAIGMLLYILSPIVEWYLNLRPLWGVDYYLTVNLASVLSQNFAMPWAFWNYGWFGGWPQFTYPFLTIYISSFLMHFWDSAAAVGVTAMGSLGLFVTGAYFLYFRVSKNHLLSFIIAVFTALSAGVYETLTWAGSVPSFSAQAALPWVLGFLIWYHKSGNVRLLLVSALICGISIFLHPLVFMTYIFPAVIILTFTRFDQGFAIIAKFKQFIIFLLIVLVIGLPQFSSSFNFAIKSLIKPDATSSALSTTSAPPTQLQLDVAKFNREQVWRIIDDNHWGIFAILIVSLVLFATTTIFARRLFSLLEILPYLLLFLYFGFYIWLFGQGISIFHGGWYRVFWSVPIWIGMLAAAAWFYSEKNVHKIVFSVPIRIAFLIGADLVFLFLGFKLYVQNSWMGTLAIVDYRGQVSSAHPDILNFRPSDAQKDQYKQSLIASWLDANQTNFRLYEPDQTVNLWWNSLFKMPLARGYLDPPIADEKRGYIFLLDASLSTTDGEPQLVSVFKYPIETAISNALFLIDWGAIKYYEGAHVGGTSSPNVPAHLKDLLVARDENVDLDYLKKMNKTRTMHYFEFKDELTSPIMSATNASTLGVFASEGGFETVVRSIAEADNINSQRLIPINLGRALDEQKLEQLKIFDALYLYDYDYKNYDKAFKMLNEYVRAGKKVFIETGVEVKQSEGDLEEFFPVGMVSRKGLGMEWNLENPNKLYSNGVDFSAFAPPVFDNSEWKMSFSEESDLRPGAQIILKNQGKVVMASQKIGSGEVIWSGLNQAYHLGRDHNQNEAKFFVNILSSVVDISKKNRPNFSVDFKNSNNREITFEGAKGILFKEMAYDGWLVKNTSKQDLGNLEIYKAGPAYPGYMYVPLKQGSKGSMKFTFSGSFSNKAQLLVSFALIVLIFEEVAMNGILLGRIRRAFWSLSRRRMSKWWEREDEE